MQATRQAVTLSPEPRVRGTSIRSLALRDLDYPTWHAHIAGIASRTTAQPSIEQRQRPTEVEPSAAMRPELRAA